MNQLISFGINYLPRKSLIPWFLKGVLPYSGKIPLALRKGLRRTMKRDLPYCKLKVLFRSKCKT